MWTNHRRLLLAVCVAGIALLVPRSVVAQIELDRILSRVNGKIITQSDVRQARALKLVANTGSDETTRRELENRLLILGELARLPSLPPVSDADLAEAQRQWQSGLGAGANGARLLSDAGMAEADLQVWMREDARIRAFLTRQFAGVPEGDRPGAITTWLARLRQRAGLD